MNLVWFLTIATIFSITLGELGQYPFGTTNFSVSVTDLLLLLTLTFLSIWKIGINKSIMFKKEFAPLIIFWLVASFSLIISGRLEGCLYLARFIFYSSAFILGYSLIDSKVTNRVDISKVIFISGFIISMLGFLQLLILPDLKYLTDFGYDPHINRLASSLLDPNFTGAFLAISVSLGLYLYLESKKKSYLLVLLLQILAIVLTFSRSAYLMLGVIVLIFGIFKNKKLLLAAIALILCLILFIPKFSERVIGGFNVDASASERFYSWQNGINLFTQNPIIGVGFNNIRSALSENNLFKSNVLDGGNAGSGIDSSILFILVTTGVIGLVSFLVFLFTVFNNMNIKSLKRIEIFKIAIIAIILGLLVNSLFINSLFYPPIMLVFYLLLGASIARI